MQRLKQYVKTKFQKHPVKLAYQDDMQYCLKHSGGGEGYCHSHICSQDGSEDYSECLEDDTLQYIILFVIIGLVGYGGYKYFK